ncbi:DUF397 domain-containing protein [Streptomyces sp. ME02-8801-2C]|uniref:DUF397 domain-containing protein n=1 Tax=Streptomyces sp. ME02-8801-2C TaxID=3028680 RepID=UPI0029BDA91A|nr:DUF397 domain-containing protein [Streptomyces sp. ME02-8801-2C]MDX3454238.1 DUF397 domain-containing protein [Streptomyces sp. ME02-8801-2C]
MTQSLNWRKSSFSGGAEGNTCVEIADLRTRIAIRDSKEPARGTLSFPTRSFTTFISSLTADVR